LSIRDDSSDKNARVAGLVMLLGVVFTISWLIVIFTGVIDPKVIFRYIWIASPLPYIGLAAGFGGNSIISNLYAIIFLMGTLLSLVGFIFSLTKRAWKVVLAGAIGTLVSIPILGVIALVFVLRSKNEFARK
jgi:hypothetical protein